MYAVFDLDNCIADDGWRVDIIQHDSENVFIKYNAYHLMSEFDKAANLHKLKEHSKDEIVILTARPDHYRKITQRWLAKHGITYDKLLMRPNRSHEHSASLKLKLMKTHKMAPEEISCAYDDRQDVVDAYKSIGINAAILKINDVDYYGEKKHENAA